MTPFSAATVPILGRNLVEASAGTGKTHAIATLFVRLLIERRLGVDQILVVTFTDAATAELRDRVRARLRHALTALDRVIRGEPPVDADAELAEIIHAGPDARATRAWLAMALESFDEAAISTIHGFCQRVLHDNAFESKVPFDADLLTDARPLREEVVHDFWALEVPGASAQFVEMLQGHDAKPSTVGSLVDRAVANPQMPVLPRQPTAIEDVPYEAVAAAFAAAAKAWDAARVGAVVTGLKLGRRYQRHHMARWFAAYDEFFAGPPPLDLSLPAHLERFGRRALAEARGSDPPHDDFFDACDALLDATAAAQAVCERLVPGFKKRLVDYARAELPRRKAEAGMLSFDDLLLTLRDGLRESGGALADAVRRRFPAALIDEFQDTDPVQYEIFDRIYREADDSLFLIGDPKQAIYAFRGADVFTYMAAKGDAPVDRCRTMTTNWRSDRTLIAAVNGVFDAADPFVFDAIGYDRVEPRPDATDAFAGPAELGAEPLQILYLRGPDGRVLPKNRAEPEIPELIAAEIATLLASGATLGDGDGARPVVAGDIAVLTRKNKQAFAVQAALQRLRIPSVVVGDQSVFESHEAAEIQHVLTAVVEPTNGLAIRAALCTDLLGHTADDLAAMERDEPRWEQQVRQFRELAVTWAARGFVQMFRGLLATHAVQRRLLRLDDGERRMTNVLHLMELLHTEARRVHLGPAGLLHWLVRQRANAAGQATQEVAEVRLESDEHAVKLTTIHKSKGLEWPIVYCPYIWDGKLLFEDETRHVLFHDPDDDDRLKYDLGSEQRAAHAKRAEHEKFAENVRLLYVALTRARHRCTVVWGRIRDHETSAFGYLVHQPDDARDTRPPWSAVAERIAGMDDDDAMLADLERWCAGKPVGLRAIELGATRHPGLRLVTPTTALSCRALGRDIGSWWRTASFSGLRRHARDPFDASDRAAADEELAPDERADAEPGPRQAELLSTAGADADAVVPLAGFPRGTRAGNFFHRILEHLDFSAADPTAREQAVTENLARFRFADDPWQSVVPDALAAILDTPLDATGALSLSRLRPGDRFDELEFHVPVAAASREAGGGEIGHVTNRKLAAIFRDHPSDALPPTYAERVASLGFLPLRGYLKGYVDLVFRHDGRYYVADYKGNHLGERFADYAQPQLLPAMAHAHYYLQYHLYAVALHRYLQRRLSGYDYGRHFGGVYYLFLRGMSPALGPACGVFFERPPQARIEALSALLAAPPRGGNP